MGVVVWNPGLFCFCKSTLCSGGNDIGYPATARGHHYQLPQEYRGHRLWGKRSTRTLGHLWGVSNCYRGNSIRSTRMATSKIRVVPTSKPCSSPMVSQLESLARHRPRPASSPARSSTMPRPAEPAVPVYRCFLSGGPDTRQLTLPSMVALATLSLAGISLGQTFAGCRSLGLGIAMAATSLAQAILVTRWRGRATGILVGVLVSASWTNVCCIAAPQAILATVAAAAAILIYGLAEISPRSETNRSAWASNAFSFAAAVTCLLGGAAFLAPIAAVCLGTILGNGNSRDLRFFASPLGLFLLATGIAVSSSHTAAITLSDPNLTPNPANPLLAQGTWYTYLAIGVTATWIMVRSGHAASPFGRFLICWLLGPAIVALTGLISRDGAAAMTLPAWAAIGGIAFFDLRPRFRLAKRPA